MAQVSHHTFSWTGQPLPPGAEQPWEFWPVGVDYVVHVTAIAIAENTTELMVKDFRVRKNLGSQAPRRFLFTVRNTGPKSVPGYYLRFSVVRP